MKDHMCVYWSKRWYDLLFPFLNYKDMNIFKSVFYLKLEIIDHRTQAWVPIPRVRVRPKSYSSTSTSSILPIPGSYQYIIGRLVLIQFVYECFACCTSIICQDKQTNIPMHIRTMDWALDFLKPLTIGM